MTFRRQCATSCLFRGLTSADKFLSPPARAASICSIRVPEFGMTNRNRQTVAASGGGSRVASRHHTNAQRLKDRLILLLDLSHRDHVERMGLLSMPRPVHEPQLAKASCTIICNRPLWPWDTTPPQTPKPNTVECNLKAKTIVSSEQQRMPSTSRHRQIPFLL